MDASRLGLLVSSLLLFIASGATHAAVLSRAPLPASANPAVSASGADATGAPVDVCSLFPRAVMEGALGRITRVRSLNITDPRAPMRTPGGSGGCFWEGSGLRHVRLEVHTAEGLARQGLGGPRRYIDVGWAIGSGATAVEGLGDVARMRPSSGRSIELIAGSADRVVHLMADGLSRDQAIAVVRAALERMPLR